MMNMPSARRRNRSGSILPLYGVTMLVILVFFGLALDIGYFYAEKGFRQTIVDISALSIMGSLDRTESSKEQLDYINQQLRNMEATNGLDSGDLKVKTLTDADGDVVQLEVYNVARVDTLMLGLAGLGFVNIGVDAVAGRGFIRSVIKDCVGDPDGSLGLFGCIRVKIAGNVLLDSYNAAGGSYASQKTISGCQLYAGDSLQVGSNRLVWANGNFCLNGDILSGLDTTVKGSSGVINGDVTTEYYNGSEDVISGSLTKQHYPELNLPSKAASATALSNDNDTVVGHNSTALAAPFFQLKKGNGSSEIELTAGKNYYFKSIDLSSSVDIRIKGNPVYAGPVNITLDGDAKINGNIVSDMTPTRPGWLEINGIACTSACCDGCRSSGVGHRDNHGKHDDYNHAEDAHSAVDHTVEHTTDTTHDTAEHTTDTTHDTTEHATDTTHDTTEHTSDTTHDSSDGHDTGHEGWSFPSAPSSHDGHSSLSQPQPASPVVEPLFTLALARGDWDTLAGAVPAARTAVTFDLDRALLLAALPGATGSSRLDSGAMYDVPVWQLPGAFNLAASSHHSSGSDHDSSGHGDSGHSASPPPPPPPPPPSTHDTHDADTHDSSHTPSVPSVSTGRCSIRFGGNSQIFANIYAPGYNVTVTGGNDFHGRIFADEVEIKGNTGYHYDQSLGACVVIVSDSKADDGERVHLIR